MNKINRYVVLTFFFLPSCKADIASEKFKQIQFQGQTIINAVETYKNKTGSIPNELEDLIKAGHFEKIPSTGIEDKKFRYGRFLPLEDNHFQLYVVLSHPIGFVFGSDKVKRVVYRSDGNYISDNVVNHLIENGWVVQDSYAR